jgi:hypothetical protein
MGVDQPEALSPSTDWSPPFVLDCPMDRVSFTGRPPGAAPELRPSDVAIRDNLPGHKSEATAELLAARSARMPFLRPTPPEPNGACGFEFYAGHALP